MRPVLSLMLTREMRVKTTSSFYDQPCLSQAMALLCSRDCIRSAQAVINLIYDRQTLTHEPGIVEPLPAWWFTTFCKCINPDPPSPPVLNHLVRPSFYLPDWFGSFCSYGPTVIYTAATALVPARVYSYIRGDILQSSLNEAWHRAVKILNRLVPLSSTASRCLAVLQLLNDESAPAIDAGNATANPTADHFKDNRNEKLVPSDMPAVARSDLPMGHSSFTDETVKAGPIMPLSMLPDEQDVSMFSSDALQAQDLTWFDSLPTDLLAIDDAELFGLSQWNQE